MKKKRVRDKGGEGGIGGGAEKGLENKMAERAEKEVWEGGENCSFSLFRSHYLQRHAVKALPLRPYTDICRRDAGISPPLQALT